jgi:hypothetical protein
MPPLKAVGSDAVLDDNQQEEEAVKIKVTMKDPDTMIDAVREAVESDVHAMGLPEDEAESLIEMRADKEQGNLAKWFRYSEYLAVEFDTETMTATVLDA